MKNKFFICCLAFFVFITFITCGCNSQSILSDLISSDSAELTVSFIDVGQGDATLIECNDSFMLIDAGTYASRYSLISYLSSQGVDTLDYCVATHPHSDHIGAMSSVIYNFDVDTLVYSDAGDEVSAWEYVLDAADERDVKYLNPNVGDTINLGGATITVLSPNKYASYSNLNNYSLVLKLEYEDVSFLFMGDAEEEIEKELLLYGHNLSSDVLKCGHHGSSTSSCLEFIAAVHPAATVISCGKDNDYGHPHAEPLNTLALFNSQVYRTDISSHITALSDGETITIKAGGEVLTTDVANEIATTPSSTKSYNYVGNLNSKVFHKSDCGSVDTIKEVNKVYFDTPAHAKTKGYRPCGACNP